MGGCIGGSYCLTLCELAPERIAAAVLQNPIGLHENRDTWDEAVRGFSKTMLRARSDLDRGRSSRSSATTCSAATSSSR